jgi:hypothetical protein
MTGTMPPSHDVANLNYISVQDGCTLSKLPLLRQMGWCQYVGSDACGH